VRFKVAECKLASLKEVAGLLPFIFVLVRYFYIIVCFTGVVLCFSILCITRPV